MTDAEPQIVAAIRVAVAGRLGLDSDDIEVRERSVPGGQQDEPFYVTLVIPSDETLDDATIDAAVVAVEQEMWQHPAYSTQLRWERKP